MFRKIAIIILKYPGWIISCIALITSLFYYSAALSDRPLRVDFSLEQMFPENDPEKDIYQNFLDEFNREDDKVLIVYDVPNPTSRENIAKLEVITEMFELDVEGIENVLSLSTIGDGEYFNDDLSDEEWNEKVVSLLNHPIYPNLIISEDGNTGAIILDIADDIISQDSREVVVFQIERVMDSVDWQWHGAGIPLLRTRYIQFMNQERLIFLPISFLVALIVLYWIFRQVKSILIPLTAISVTLIWVAGIMALLDISINVVSYLTFNLLMIIGTSNAIHLLVKYHEGLGRGLSQKDALSRVVEKIGGALFLTSFTTAVGFCSLALTNIRVTQEFGLIVGFGVILMFLLTIIIMPIILHWINPPDKVHIDRLIAGGKFAAAHRLHNWNIHHPKTVFSLTLILFFGAVIGLTKINYNASVFEDLKPGNPVFDDLQVVEEKLGGTLPLEIIIDTGEEMGALSPGILLNIQKFKKDLLTIPEINTALTAGDYLSLVNEEIGSGNRELPHTQEEALSFVYQYENLESFLNEEISKSRITCRISDVPFDRGMAIRDQVITYGKQHLGEGVQIQVTGSTILALSTNRHLVKNLSTSFIIAFIIIFLSMVLLFRSFRLSLISILPNIIPLMLAGGIMGYLGIKLRPSTAMTFSIALGIAVDNTIHFLARFRQEFKEKGSYKEAVSETLFTTGKAVISTGVILSLGFFVLYFSEFVPNHEFGLLATIIIITAVAGSLILLPVLLTTVQPTLRFNRNSENQ
ncbi:MAG: MMPL family transporter [Candidatus Marinimicrobia bacterium]|nr:MMPL family transporter [Candidatus Neomarinimicrobiota bacterium]